MFGPKDSTYPLLLRGVATHYPNLHYPNILFLRFALRGIRFNVEAFAESMKINYSRSNSSRASQLQST